MARLIVGFVDGAAAFAAVISIAFAGVDRLENALARITSPINLPLYWPRHFLPLLSHLGIRPVRVQLSLYIRRRGLSS